PTPGIILLTAPLSASYAGSVAAAGGESDAGGRGLIGPVPLTSGLHSDYALMAVQDRAQGHRPGTCGACGNLCLATTRAALYCSVKCRNTAQKRRQRRRAKAKQAAR